MPQLRFNQFAEQTEINERQQKKISQMSPEQHKAHRQAEAEGIQFHKDHPISHHNIVHHFEQATPEEHHAGMHWYSDAHHTMKALAKDTGVEHHQMAGLIGNYSPQTHWHTNILTAARVAREKRAMGGKGSGIFADERQKNNAHRILMGEHYNNVIKGQKVRHFTHLIEHGGNQHPDKPHVAIDRHAYSVAAGARLSDAAFAHAGLKSPKKYKEVHHAYVKAAEHLSKTQGKTIHPHQVQAVTWLVRQRLNQEGEHATQKGGGSKLAMRARASKENWNKYAGEHHPHLIGHEPGTGYAGGGGSGTKFHRYPLA